MTTTKLFSGWVMVDAKDRVFVSPFEQLWPLKGCGTILFSAYFESKEAGRNRVSFARRKLMDEIRILKKGSTVGMNPFPGKTVKQQLKATQAAHDQLRHLKPRQITFNVVVS